MSLQDFLITDDDDGDLTALDPTYQANMYTIEEAMRQLGKTEAPRFVPSSYDDALMKLIDSVPLE